MDGDYSINIVSSFGNQCEESNCITEYNLPNTNHPITDFLGPCENCCKKFIRFGKNKDIKPIEPLGSIGEKNLLNFLGDIDNFDEAIWLIRHKSYPITDSEHKGFIKKTENGFQFIATKYTSFCEPEIIEEHLLEVKSSGDISVLNTKIISKKDICLMN